MWAYSSLCTATLLQLGDKQQRALMGIEVGHSPNNAVISSILHAAHAAVLDGR
jgi:hypothetical protein